MTDNTGVVRTYHDKEQTILKEEYFQLNGKINGIYREYHDNGCELTNVNSKRENLSLINSLGQLKEEKNYIDGKINGIYKLYYDNGQLLKEVNYINGKKC